MELESLGPCVEDGENAEGGSETGATELDDCLTRGAEQNRVDRGWSMSSQRPEDLGNGQHRVVSSGLRAWDGETWV
jgi:hypothetical protein